MNRIILDTETAGKINTPLVYDLGYIIIDDNGNTIKQRSYIIKEVYDNKKLFNTSYFKEKRPLYEERLKSGYSKKVYLAYALRQLTKDMEKYGVDLYAYNSPFDTKAIKHTREYFKKEKYNPTQNGIIDIMKLVSNITNTQDYNVYCNKYNFTTKHKPPRSQRKAQTLYSYLTNNPNYQEEHTALEDSKIEAYILLATLK